MSLYARYLPGDVVDGYVLGPDGRWRPARADYYRIGKRVVVASAVIVVLGLAAGLLALLGVVLEVSRSEYADAGSPGVWGANLAVGDCFTDPGDASEGFLDVVPCRQAHDSEVVLVDEDYFSDLDGPPSGQQILQATDDACVEALVAYTGQAYESGNYDVWAFAPSEGNWADGDRALTCVGVVGAGQDTKVSMRAATA